MSNTTNASPTYRLSAIIEAPRNCRDVAAYARTYATPSVHVAVDGRTVLVYAKVWR